jgi:hypothetical protein
MVLVGVFGSIFVKQVSMAFSFMRVNQSATGHASVSGGRKEPWALCISKKKHGVKASRIEIH